MQIFLDGSRLHDKSLIILWLNRKRSWLIAFFEDEAETNKQKC